MKLKLTKAEFDALYSFFTGMIKDAKPEGMNSRMLLSTLMDIYEKMYRKAFKRKENYTVVLKDHEAIGFWFFFQKYPFPAKMIFEANLVHQINNNIHQKFS